MPRVGEAPPSRLHVMAVGFVDVGLLAAVLAWGLQIHLVDPIEMAVHATLVATPFLGSWLVIATIVGAYQGAALTQFRWGIPLVLVAWLGASLAGAAIRSTSLIPGQSPLIFVGVVFGVGAVILLPWRALVCLTSRA